MTLKINMLMGTIELQQRNVYLGDWLIHEARRIERNEHGEVVLTSPWQECGGRMFIGEPPPPRSWWQRMVSAWRRQP